MIKTILVILALAILASACTVDADECSNGYRAGKRQVKRMWRNRGSQCSNIDGFDDAVQRMIQNRYHPRNDGTLEVAHRCAERGANDMLAKYRQECNSHIHCIRPRQSRVKEEGHEEVCEDLTPNYVPYVCEFGDKLCCTESSMTTVTFKNKKHWGVCTEKDGSDGQETGDEDDDNGDDDDNDDEEPTESEGDDDANNDNNDKDDRVCDEYFLRLCCDGECSEGSTNYETSDEVRAAKVCKNTCLDEGGRKCSWRWRAKGCRYPKKKKGSIGCIRPRQGKILKEGHKAVCAELSPKDVPYVCEDESRLCCTDSSMTKVTFKDKDWGECRKMEEL